MQNKILIKKKKYPNHRVYTLVNLCLSSIFIIYIYFLLHLFSFILSVKISVFPLNRDYEGKFSFSNIFLRLTEYRIL